MLDTFKSRAIGAAITAAISFFTWLVLSIQHLEKAQAISEYETAMLKQITEDTNQLVRETHGMIDCVIKTHPDERQLRQGCLNSVKR